LPGLDRTEQLKPQPGRAVGFVFAGGAGKAMIEQRIPRGMIETPLAFEGLNMRGQVQADSGDAAAGLADLDRYLATNPHPISVAYVRSARALALARLGPTTGPAARTALPCSAPSKHFSRPSEEADPTPEV
jgi:hypothetical protein